MLVEIAISDAYGAGFEYVPQDIVTSFNNGKSYRQHNFHAIKPGMYTDDTQMSLAIVELMLSGKEWSQRNLATFFLDCFKRDPRKGYSRGFQFVLENSQTVDEMYSSIFQHGKSDKNGGCMRACPVGLFKTLDEVLQKSAIQAEVTHKGTGVVAGQMVSASVWFLRNGGSKEQLWSFLRSVFTDVSIAEWPSGTRVESKDDLGLKTALAAITAVINSSSFEEALIKAVGFGGDTDTVAAIVGGIVSVSKEHTKIIEDMPLFSGLENKNFGRDYLLEIDNKLFTTLVL